MSVPPEVPRTGAPETPGFPPALLALLGVAFLVAPGDASRVESRVGLSAVLLLVALAWIAALRLVDRRAAAPASWRARPPR